MAVRVPVWRDWTSATVPTPRAAPRATLPSQPLLPPGEEEPFPWLDFQNPAVAVVENFSALAATLIWPRTGLVAGFPPSWRLPLVKMCLNLTPGKVARTRGTGPVHRGALMYENRADICSAMPEWRRGDHTDRAAVTQMSPSQPRRGSVSFSTRSVHTSVTKRSHVPYLFLDVNVWNVPFTRGAKWLLLGRQQAFKSLDMR